MKKYLAMSVAVTAILASCNPSNTTTPTSTTFTSTYAGWTGGAKDVEFVTMSPSSPPTFTVIKTGTITSAGVISIPIPSESDVPSSSWSTASFNSTCTSVPTISDSSAKITGFMIRVKGTSNFLVQTDGEAAGYFSPSSRTQGKSAVQYMMSDKNLTINGVADCSSGGSKATFSITLSDGKFQSVKDTVTKNTTPYEITYSNDSTPSTLPWATLQ